MPDSPAEAFDAAAASFTELGTILWEPIGQHLARCAAPRPGERVLDACCGDGASALPAARAVGEKGQVDAIDLSHAMVDLVRNRSRDLPQITAHQHDVSAWDRDGYDVVQCALGIFFFPDMTTGTEHLISRARSGGRVALTIWQERAIEAVGPHLRAARTHVTGETSEERPRALIDEINRADPYARWLAARGLEDIRVEALPLTLTLTPHTAWLLVIGSGFAGLLTGFSDEQVEQFRLAYLDSLDRAGLTQLDATTLTAVGRRS